MYLILITGADSGYCPVPCGIPQGSWISECEGVWEFPDSGISGSGKRVTSREIKERTSQTSGRGIVGIVILILINLGTEYKYL